MYFNAWDMFLIELVLFVRMIDDLMPLISAILHLVVPLCFYTVFILYIIFTIFDDGIET